MSLFSYIQQKKGPVEPLGVLNIIIYSVEPV